MKPYLLICFLKTSVAANMRFLVRLWPLYFFVLSMLFTAIGSAYAIPTLLAASATSSSPNSSPVICLINTQCNGQWSPGSVDAGHDEGLYFQFDQEVELNFIEVVLSGKIEPYQINVLAYLDGKTTTPKELVVTNKQIGSVNSDETLILIGARDSDASSNRPMDTKIRSLFLKLETWGSKSHNIPTPIVKRIRLYKKFEYFEPSASAPMIKLTTPIEINMPQIVSAEVKATSVLPPVFAYDPSHLFDSMADMAWATDGAKSLGRGESVFLEFKEPVEIASMMIWNGYQRSATHFKANARIGTLWVTSNTNQTPQKLTLEDISGAQLVNLLQPLQHVKTLKLTIDKVLPGSKYKDVLLSELRFLDRAGHIIIPTVQPVRPVVPASLTSVINQSYALFLHNISVGGPEEHVEKCTNGTLRIKGNGTFVIYKDFDYGTSNISGAITADVIEGNWEPKGDGIRIFGKKYTTSLRSAEYLEGLPEAAQATVFQSDMTLAAYGKLTKPERMQVLKSLKNQRLPFTKVLNDVPSNHLYWSEQISGSSHSDLDEIGYYIGENEEKLLNQVDSDLKLRNPLVIKSSVFNGLVLPTDTVNQCVSGW